MCYSLPCNGRFVTKEHKPTVCNNSVHVLLHLYIGLWFEPKILKMLDSGIADSQSEDGSNGYPRILECGHTGYEDGPLILLCKLPHLQLWSYLSIIVVVPAAFSTILPVPSSFFPVSALFTQFPRPLFLAPSSPFVLAHRTNGHCHNTKK